MAEPARYGGGSGYNRRHDQRIAQMEETVLPVRGPAQEPARPMSPRGAILESCSKQASALVRVDSREAIRNVLLKCVKAGQDANRNSSSTSSTKSRATMTVIRMIARSGAQQKTKTLQAGHQIVGGTASFFARDENVQAYDWLFVDEAGQVGLCQLVYGALCSKHRSRWRSAAVRRSFKALIPNRLIAHA